MRDSLFARQLRGIKINSRNDAAPVDDDRHPAGKFSAAFIVVKGFFVCVVRPSRLRTPSPFRLAQSAHHVSTARLANNEPAKHRRMPLLIRLPLTGVRTEQQGNK